MNVPLNVDPEVMRARVHAAIEEQQNLISDLRSNLPDFPAEAVGEGFTARAAALSDALVSVQHLSIAFGESRIAAWEQLLSLVDAIERHDQENADDLGGGVSL